MAGSWHLNNRGASALDRRPRGAIHPSAHVIHLVAATLASPAHRPHENQFDAPAGTERIVDRPPATPHRIRPHTVTRPRLGRRLRRPWIFAPPLLIARFIPRPIRTAVLNVLLSTFYFLPSAVAVPAMNTRISISTLSGFTRKTYAWRRELDDPRLRDLRRKFAPLRAPPRPDLADDPLRGGIGCAQPRNDLRGRRSRVVEREGRHADPVEWRRHCLGRLIDRRGNGVPGHGPEVTPRRAEPLRCAELGFGDRSAHAPNASAAANGAESAAVGCGCGGRCPGTGSV